MHSTCLHLHFPGNEEGRVLFSAAELVRGQNVTLLISYFSYSLRGMWVGQKHTSIVFLFLFLNKYVIKSVVTDFKQVPVTGQNEMTILGDWTETHQPREFLYFRCFCVSCWVEMFLSWSLWCSPSERSVCGTPKQIPSNSLQSLNTRQLQPLFPGRCQSWRQRSLWRRVGVCQSFKE